MLVTTLLVIMMSIPGLDVASAYVARGIQQLQRGSFHGFCTGLMSMARPLA